MDEKKKALELAMNQIEKQFGKGAVMKLGENLHLNIETIPTGCLSLDIALGIGGVPRGRIVEIFGPESSGKTTVALHILAEAQRNGGEVAFIDAEHALDPVYAKNLGVDVDSLLVSQPDTGEQALEIAEALVRSGAIDVVVVEVEFVVAVVGATPSGGTITVIVQVALFPLPSCAVAVIVAVPAAFAVTTPFDTVATLVLLLLHVTFLLLAVLGLAVAVNVSVEPTFNDSLVLFKLISVTYCICVFISFVYSFICPFFAVATIFML